MPEAGGYVEKNVSIYALIYARHTSLVFAVSCDYRCCSHWMSKLMHTCESNLKVSDGLGFSFQSMAEAIPKRICGSTHDIHPLLFAAGCSCNRNFCSHPISKLACACESNLVSKRLCWSTHWIHLYSSMLAATANSALTQFQNARVRMNLISGNPYLIPGIGLHPPLKKHNNTNYETCLIWETTNN